MMGGREIVKTLLFRGVYPGAYRLGCLRRADSRRVLFVEVRGAGLSDNFRSLWKELKSRGLKPLLFCTDNTSGRGYLKDYIRLAFRAAGAGHIVLNDTCNLFGALPLRKSTRVVQLWHGCGAFKKWGLSIAGKGFGESAEEQKRYPAHRCYSLVCVSSPEVVQFYEEAFGIEKGITKPLGVPRTDVYFRKNAPERALERIHKAHPFTRGRRILLWAPTFRGETGKAHMPPMPELARLRDALGEKGWVMLIKPHGFVKERCRIPEDCRGFAAETDLPIEQLLLGSDLLVTDYSSVIFEYSLTGRGMVFYAPDLESYFDSRGFYYPYDESFLPGEVAGDTESLIAAILRADPARTAPFRVRFMSACDGQSTQRVADWMTADRE